MNYSLLISCTIVLLYIYVGPACGSECTVNACADDGVCSNVTGVINCTCADGSGHGCFADDGVSVCDSEPCLNGAACVGNGSSYDCICSAGYTGATCDENIDDCAAVTCLNGGTCVDEVAGHICTCAEGYNGDDCGTAVTVVEPEVAPETNSTATTAAPAGTTAPAGSATVATISLVSYGLAFVTAMFI